MKKKLLALCLVVVLLVTAVVGGTMAFYADTDSDVNVMTLGNVKIEQHEYQRVVKTDGTYPTGTFGDKTSYLLEEFEHGKPLYPIVGDPSSPEGYPHAGWDDITVRMSQVDSYGGMPVFAGKNAQDKFVTVENTGKNDAYIRTIVAIEVGTGNADLIGTSYHSNWSKNAVGKVEIDGNNYYVYEYIYKGASDGSRHVGGVLPAGETSYPNLSQVYLKSVATNEDVEALDGNDNGTLDILVLSQAVQAEGFANAQTALDTAFGKSTDKAAEWFSRVLHNTVMVEGNDKAAVVAAIEKAESGDIVKLTEDTTIDGYAAANKLVINKDIILDLNGKTLTTECGWGGIDAKGGCSIVNGTINHTGNTAAIKAFQVKSIENVTINVTQTEGKIKGGIVVQQGSGCYVGSIKNVTITGATNGIETYLCGDRTDYAIGSLENVTIDATDTGMLLSAPVGTATDRSIKGEARGVEMYLKGTYSVSLNLVNSTVTGTTGIYAHDEKGYENPGSLTLTYDSATTITGGITRDFENAELARVTIG